MCYHVSTPSVRALKNEHKDGFRITDESDRWGAYDHPDLPATLMVGQEDFTSLEWPLIPHWAKDLEHARFLQGSGHNARSETMFEKPMFRDAAMRSRCLIWIDGFYEWQHVTKKKKIQYFIHMPDRELFAVGGLMSRWRNPADGEIFQTCAIVTTEANSLMAEIHNSPKNGKRMPLIVPDEVKSIWLNHGTSRAEVEGVCLPYEDGILQAKLLGQETSETNQVELF
jgi:putative SOS response-associated peptidase YedK